MECVSFEERLPNAALYRLYGTTQFWEHGIGSATALESWSLDHGTLSLQWRCRAVPPPRLGTWAVKLIGALMA